MPILEMRKLSLNIMKKGHPFSKWYNQGSQVVSLTQKFVFPLFLPPHLVPAPKSPSSSKNVPNSKETG